MRVGYIGLGALGSELAARFLPTHELNVWDLSEQAVARLVQRGARGAAAAREVACASDVVFLCLPRTADVRTALFSEHGVVAGLSRQTLVIDQTSGIPGETREIAAQLAARGIAMIDAAVSASPQVVPLGQAKLMVAGPGQAIEQARPALMAIAEAVYWCGERVGDGQAMKTVNNAMNAGCRIGTLELAALGRKLGLSLAEITEAFNGGSGRNLTTERMLPAIAKGTRATDFALSLMIKDLNQALDLGAQAGVPMPLSSVVRGVLEIGSNTLGSSARLEDMIGVVQSISGTVLRDDPAQGATAQAVEPQLAGLLDAALQAVCWITTLECVAAGLQYGLAIDRMHDVLNTSSGWSTAGRQLLSGMASGESIRTSKVRASARALQQVMDLGMRAAMPLLTASAARMQYQGALNLAGEAVDAAQIIRLYRGGIQGNPQT